MHCNYDCAGCYSRDRSTENELLSEELNIFFTQAENYGVHTIVLTGGEPLLRLDLPDLILKHKNLLFILITNGSLITPEIAHSIKSDNIIPLVSIEGPSQYTDERRNPGAYETAIKALSNFQKAKLNFGFAATITKANFNQVVSDTFIDHMIAMRCSLGAFIEYVPCGPKPRLDWVMDTITREDIRQHVLKQRRQKPIILIQFPHDEYGSENHCKAAGQTFLHINAQGDVEPCPFVSISRDNIRSGGLLAACQSTFMRDIREQPQLLQRNLLACSLFEHRDEIAILAKKHAKLQETIEHNAQH